MGVGAKTGTQGGNRSIKSRGEEQGTQRWMRRDYVLGGWILEQGTGG